MGDSAAVSDAELSSDISNIWDSLQRSGSGAGRAVAAGASERSSQGARDSRYGSRGTEGILGGASSGLIVECLGRGRDIYSEENMAPATRRISGDVGQMGVSGCAGRVSRGTRDGGGGAEANEGEVKPRSGRYTRLARFGPGLGSSQGSNSVAYKASQARSHNMRSGAAQFGAAAMGFGGMDFAASSGRSSGGGNLNVRNAGTSTFGSQRTTLGGIVGAKPSFGVMAGASSGMVQSYAGRRGSNAAVGIGGGMGAAGTSGGFGGSVGFGRHKYG